MSGEKRRDRLLQYLEEHDKPVSGTELAKEFGVSRQVIEMCIRDSHMSSRVVTTFVCHDTCIIAGTLC